MHRNPWKDKMQVLAAKANGAAYQMYMFDNKEAQVNYSLFY